MNRPFIKMHGLGNDFVIFDARKKPLKLKRDSVRAISDRRFGVGCDQLIVIESSKKAKAFMRIYNADGGEVSSCGNATRCVAWLLMEETGKKDITLATKAGIIAAKRIGKNLIAADMGKPGLEWKQIPLKYKCDTLELPIQIPLPHRGRARVGAGLVDVYCKAQQECPPPNLPPVGGGMAVSMGNPHMVFVVPNVDAVHVKEAGAKLEHHALFPERANVSFAQIVNSGKIKLRVWERGAGETLACGTAACASVVALHRKGLLSEKADVVLPGGTLAIEWNQKTGHVWMTGAVAVAFEGAVNV